MKLSQSSFPRNFMGWKIVSSKKTGDLSKFSWFIFIT